MKFSSFKHFCRESKSVAIYALYPESFCLKNLAIRKVFAFSDSGLVVPTPKLLESSPLLLLAPHHSLSHPSSAPACLKQFVLM